MKIRSTIFFASDASAKNSRAKVHFLVLGLLTLALLSGLIVQSDRAAAQKQDAETIVPSATFTVTNTLDAGAGSLRQAILDANGTAGADLISFSILGTGPFTIQPLSALPNITDAVTIDGYTQTGATANASCSGTAALQIVVSGAGAGASSSGLTLAAGSAGSTVRGLVINGFDGNGIEILSGGNFITGNFIGTDSAGTVAVPNVSNGISITSGSTNTIGGSTVGLRNVISGNTGRGIVVNGIGGTSGNFVQGNYIGTNAAGTAAIANGSDGVDISQSANNTIGGDATTALGCAPGNLISGNAEDGINIFGTGATGNIVQGNLIGTNAAGTADLGNISQGVYLNASSNTIGGATATVLNVISGNDGGGVNIGGGTSNFVERNFIGTNLSGTAALRNPDGVRIDNGATGNTVFANLISGNDVGVHINEGSSNFVRGNLIGTGADGTSDLGNLEAGVYIHEPTSTGNVVGGTVAGEGNTIRFNGDGVLIPTLFGEGGVVVFAGATGNAILRNSINNNEGLGIDLGALGANGVTLNDPPPDADSGDGNNYQNYPVLTTASSGSGMTAVSGTLASSPNTMFRVEFFSVPTADPSGNGEGLVYLGFTNVTTDAAGTATFSFSATPAVTTGHFVTATATNTTNSDTSEFSMARQVLGPTAASVSVAGRVSASTGISVSGAHVTMIASDGTTRTTRTNMFGYFRFDNIQSGESYVVTVTHKRYQFASLLINVSEDIVDLDITAEL